MILDKHWGKGGKSVKSWGWNKDFRNTVLLKLLDATLSRDHSTFLCGKPQTINSLADIFLPSNHLQEPRSLPSPQLLSSSQ